MAYTFSRNAHTLAVLVGLLAAVSLASCRQQEAPKTSESTANAEASDNAETSDSHEGHDHSQDGKSESFAEGVAELQEHYGEIKTAFAESDSEKAIEMAHEPLHGIGRILESLPELAEKANLSTEDTEAVKGAVKTMFECYGNIDGAVHDGNAPDYQAEADKLDEAMAAIETVLGQTQQ